MNQSFKLLIVLFLFIAAGCGTAKNAGKTSAKKTKTFEGKIIYDFKFEDRTGEMDANQMRMIMGDTNTYSIKGNKYLHESNGMMTMKTYYLGGDTIFNAMSGMENLFWIDATSADDEFIDFKITKNAATILEMPCDLLTINSEQGVTQYYYNPLLKVDPEDYEDHAYGFWNFCIEKTGSLPLKSVSDLEDSYISMTALEVIEEKLSDSVFDLPDWPRSNSTSR